MVFLGGYQQSEDQRKISFPVEWEPSGCNPRKARKNRIMDAVHFSADPILFSEKSAAPKVAVVRVPLSPKDEYRFGDKQQYPRGGNDRVTLFQFGADKTNNTKPSSDYGYSSDR